MTAFESLTRSRDGAISFLDSATVADRAPLVFVHGVFDSAECWAGVIAGLPDDRRMIAVDVRAHGQSPLTEGPFAMTGLGEDVARVVERLGRPAILVGHSMGGVISQQVALTRPELVAGLVLEDPGWVAAEQTSAGAELPEFVERRGKELAAWSPGRILAQGVEDHPRWHRDEFPSWLQAKLDVDLDFLRAPHEWKGVTGVEACGRLAMPTLLVTGDVALGAIVTEEAAALASAVSRGRVSVERIEDAGHDIRKDQRAAFLSTLRAFIAEIDAMPTS